MKQMAQIVYVSPCPNCVRGVCKIKKHHQLLYHRHQFVPILETSASTSGSTTPNRLQMLEAPSNGGLLSLPYKSTSNQKQSKTADCRCLIQTVFTSCRLRSLIPFVSKCFSEAQNCYHRVQKCIHRARKCVVRMNNYFWGLKNGASGSKMQTVFSC